MFRLGCFCLAAFAAFALRPAGPQNVGAATIDDWTRVAQALPQAWPMVQRRDGSFPDYVVANAPRGPLRDQYGPAALGLALLQAGIRDRKDRLTTAGLRSVGYALRHPVPRDRVVFENLALATAWNVSRRALAGDPGFKSIRARWAQRLRRARVMHLRGPRPYYNYDLVESVAILELLRSGLRSGKPGTVLAQRRLAGRLARDLVNRRLAAAVRPYTGIVPGTGRTVILSDPPWNPLAYQAFSAGLLARAIDLMGTGAPRSTRDLLRAALRASSVLAAPDGDLSYYGRSQEQGWILTMTAYAAETAAALPGTTAADAARFRALSERALQRFERLHVGGGNRVLITPAFAADARGAVRGLDPYAAAVPYTGLALVGLNWALERMGHGERALSLPADASGSAVLGAGESRIAIVRRDNVWYAVKQGPGVRVPKVGDYSGDVRYDPGLVALKVARGGGFTDTLPLRPFLRAARPAAAPVLHTGTRSGRLWGTGLRVAGDGSVTLVGGFRSAGGWMRKGVALRYEPLGCGVRMTMPTKRHDRFEQWLFFRRRPTVVNHGRTLSDSTLSVSIDRRARVSIDSGFASGMEARLVRARLRVAGGGGPLTMTFCAAE